MNQLDDLEKSISLAVDIMLKQAPLVEGYMQVMVNIFLFSKQRTSLTSSQGGAEALKKIIHWRMMPTPANNPATTLLGKTLLRRFPRLPGTA